MKTRSMVLSTFERLPAQKIWGESDNSASLRLRKSYLMKSLNALTEVERRHIELYYLKGLKCREIAELFGTGVPTVSRNLARARRKLTALAQIAEDSGVFATTE